MIEKFACTSGWVAGEFLDLNHTAKSMILVPLMIAKFAHHRACEHRRTSESGH
jgi:hypothetical protein